MAIRANISRFVGGIAKGCNPELGDHLGRVCALAERFARRIGFSTQEAKLLSLGAGVHDFGKVLIDGHILNKPGRLTDPEFALIKTHSELGMRLLAPLGLDRRVGELVHFHHENFDGSGYPKGLAGDAIPPFAQVIRIVDSFDAITEDRPYRKSRSDNDAIETMRQHAHCYNPEYLDLFFEMILGTQTA